MMLGTPQYISPEQARGDRDLDPGTDIYSFGVVLYEMVVGRVPFNADTPFSIIHDHIFTPLPLPSQVNPLVPESVERVLLKALAKDRADRYPSVEALVEALRASVTGRTPEVTRAHAEPAAPGHSAWPVASPSEATGARVPVLAAPDSAATGQQKRPRFSKRTWIVIASVIVLGCACLAILALASDEKQGVADTPAPQTVEATEVRRPAGEDLERTRQAVAEDGENPVLRLELASALRESGQPRLAYAEFVKAGNLLMVDGRQPEAAEAYLQALSLPGVTGERADPEVTARAEQALFLSAPDRRSLDLVQEGACPGAAMAEPAHARGEGAALCRAAGSGGRACLSSARAAAGRRAGAGGQDRTVDSHGCGRGGFGADSGNPTPAGAAVLAASASPQPHRGHESPVTASPCARAALRSTRAVTRRPRRGLIQCPLLGWTAHRLAATNRQEAAGRARCCPEALGGPGAHEPMRSSRLAMQVA